MSCDYWFLFFSHSLAWPRCSSRLLFFLRWLIGHLVTLASSTVFTLLCFWQYVVMIYFFRFWFGLHGKRWRTLDFFLWRVKIPVNSHNIISHTQDCSGIPISTPEIAMRGLLACKIIHTIRTLAGVGVGYAFCRCINSTSDIMCQCQLSILSGFFFIIAVDLCTWVSIE